MPPLPPGTRAHTSQAGLPYLLSLPLLLHETAAPKPRSWPLIVYLHGAGESGTNPAELLSEGATGTPPMLAAARAEHIQEYVVVAPQTDRGWGGQKQVQNVIALLDDLLADPRLGLDPSRVYLTGVSMGGHGVWRIGAAHPGRFAALVPVCGSGDPAHAARALAHKPIYAWHAANDAVVPVAATDQIVEALKAAGSSVRYERLPSGPAPVGWPDYVGHASWIPAFAAESPLWPWLRQHVGPPP